jgi:NAD(P)-dependent dehydrogenase (short-subunit alcohol dehydrogenase family)
MGTGDDDVVEIDLAGRNALVTGGAAGIGRDSAIRLADAGARVAVADINLPGAEQTVDAMGDGLAIYCDLAEPRQVTDMCQQARAALGGVDILVNCGGIISYREGIGPVTLDEWDRVLDVNLRSMYLVCRELVENMKARRDGRIINFASLAGRIGGIETGIHYAASKAGVVGFSRTLAKEVGPYGITVNVLAPGVILTGPVQQQIGGREDSYIRQIPLRRLGQPRDVADVVLFLASPLAGYLTGLVVDINGGLYMG